MAGSTSSPELLPDAMEVEVPVEMNANKATEQHFQDDEERSAEGGLPTGHFEEDLQDMPEDWDDFLGVSWEVDGILKEVEKRTYEQGPPVLSPDELSALDEKMDEVEIQRLLGLKVLEEMNSEENTNDMFKLGCKNVRDWRFRQGGWQRRSRLVAKEFRFLQPFMENLYSPASLSSTQRLLAGLCCGDSRLCLYSGDIKDAYLTVKQRRKTFIVTAGGTKYKLLYNLPGQRAGAKDWREKLKSVLESDGLRAFEGAPALFIEPKALMVSTHVDDLQMLGLRERVDRLIKNIGKANLEFAVEGPCAPWYGECHFLKRRFSGVNGCILVEQDTKHVEKLIRVVGVEKESGKQVPCPLNPHDVKNCKPLGSEKYQIYRTCIGILLYLGPDRPECLYAIKVLSAKTSQPTEHEWHLLKYLVRYLKLHLRRGISLSSCNPGRTAEQRWLGSPGPEREDDVSNPFGGRHLVESISDASWASEPDRRSISASVIYLNGNAIYVGNKRQKSISLSSCESEVHGSLFALQEGLFLKRVVETVCGHPVQLRHRVDSSSCRAFIDRVGLGRLKHIDLPFLWIQDHRAQGMFDLKAIPAKFCPPDIATKAMTNVRARMLSFTIGVCESGGHLVGQEEFEEEWAREQLKKIQHCRENFAGKSARRVLALLLAADGLSLVDGAQLVSQTPKPSFMFAICASLVMATILICVVLIFNGEYENTAVAKGERAENTTVDESSHRLDGYKVTRKLEESVEFYEQKKENLFAENAFYVLAIFSGAVIPMVGWLAYQAGLRGEREGPPPGAERREPLLCGKGHGREHRALREQQLPHREHQRREPQGDEQLPHREHQRREPQGDEQLPHREPQRREPQGDEPLQEGGLPECEEDDWDEVPVEEIYGPVTPREVRLHRLYRDHGISYSEELLSYWEVNHTLSLELLEKFAKGESASSSTPPMVWIIGHGKAYHMERCGMVTKGKKSGKAKSVTLAFALRFEYKKCGQCCGN